MADNRFITFLSLVNTRSYTKTANELFISQPGVTHHIKSLEAEYKCKLFVVINKRLELTEAGERMVLYARKEIEEFDELVSSFEALGEKIKVLRMAIDNHLVKLLSNFDFTGLEVVDNDFDFKISDQFDEALVNIEIKIFDCALAVNKNSLMALRKRITNKALKNAKWLVLNKKDYLYQALIEYLDSDLNALEINNIDILLSSIKDDKIAILPLHLINDDLVRIKIPDFQIKERIYFQYPKNHPNIDKLLRIKDDILYIL